jgi:hypothetical protein
LTFIRPEPSLLDNGSLEFWGEDAKGDMRVRCLLSASALALIRRSEASTDPSEVLPIVMPIAARLFGAARDKDVVFIGMSTFQSAPEAQRFRKGRRKTAGPPFTRPIDRKRLGPIGGCMVTRKSDARVSEDSEIPVMPRPDAEPRSLKPSVGSEGLTATRPSPSETTASPAKPERGS